MRRAIASIVIAASAAVGATSCSTGSPASGAGSAGPGAGGPQATGTAQVMSVMRQFAACVRGHGVPSFPDPVINPLTGRPDIPSSAQRVPSSALQACQPIADRLPPQVQTSQPPTTSAMRALLAFARCMRSRGFPNWPDPNALGEYPITTQMGAQMKRGHDSVSACARNVPGGTQYLRFVRASGGGNG
jgi:hypothetical protein